MIVSSPPPEMQLEQLARQARAGCCASFDELARRVSPGLLSFLRQRSASLQDAEDLRQETLLKVYQKLETYDSDRPFGPWLMTIAARLAAGRARSRESIDQLRDEVDVAVEEGHAGREVDQREAGQVLWKSAARMLPAAQYRALRLRYVDQLDVRGVAEAMSVSMANAKVLLLRARRRLMASRQVRALLDGRPAGQGE